MFVALALAAFGLNMGSAKANLLSISDSDATCPNTYSVCVNFALSQNSGTGVWTLTSDYVSSPSGLLTSTGAYYNAGNTAPSFGISNVTLLGSPTGWTSGGCTDLNMNSGSTDLLGACASTAHGINDALAPGDSISLTFTANTAFTNAVLANNIDYRAHIQGYGSTSCSIKLDTGVTGNIGSAGSDCIVPPSVPEPATLALFAAGLAALGLGFAFRRRASQG
jgi:hypothetical protein